MSIEDKSLNLIAQLFLRTKDINKNEWEKCTFVFELGEGCVSNSGFLYKIKIDTHKF